MKHNKVKYNKTKCMYILVGQTLLHMPSQIIDFQETKHMYSIFHIKRILIAILPFHLFALWWFRRHWGTLSRIRQWSIHQRSWYSNAVNRQHKQDESESTVTLSHSLEVIFLNQLWLPESSLAISLWLNESRAENSCEIFTTGLSRIWLCYGYWCAKGINTQRAVSHLSLSTMTTITSILYFYPLISYPCSWEALEGLATGGLQ